jgi:hypothetical protein
MARGGKRPGQGNPGYKKIEAIEEGVRKLTPRWFAEVEGMLDSKLDDTLRDDVKQLIKELFPKDSYTTKELIKYLARGAMEDKKFALSELTKLTGKLMPQEITGKGGGALKIEWLSQSPTIQGTGQKPSTPASSAG